MPSHDEHLNTIHAPEWWEADDERADAAIDPYRDIPLADITPEIAMRVAALALHGVIQLRMVVREMALEAPTPPTSTLRRRKPNATLAEDSQYG